MIKNYRNIFIKYFELKMFNIVDISTYKYFVQNLKLP